VRHTIVTRVVIFVLSLLGLGCVLFALVVKGQLTSVGFHIHPAMPIPFPIGFSQMHWYKSCRALQVLSGLVPNSWQQFPWGWMREERCRER
jgi:hypothetical protein